MKGRIKFYIFLAKITIAAGIAVFGFRTLLEKIMNRRLTSEAHIQFAVDTHNLCMVFHAFYKSILASRVSSTNTSGFNSAPLLS